MYQANFWHMILKMLYYIPNYYTTNLEELAIHINHSLEIMLKQELEKKEKFNDCNLILKKYIRRHDDIEVTLLEIDILKMMLIRLNQSETNLDNLICLKRNILLLIAACENLTLTLENCDYKSLYNKKLYLKRQ